MYKLYHACLTCTEDKEEVSQIRAKLPTLAIRAAKSQNC